MSPAVLCAAYEAAPRGSPRADRLAFLRSAALYRRRDPSLTSAYLDAAKSARRRERAINTEH